MSLVKQEDFKPTLAILFSIVYSKSESRDLHKKSNTNSYNKTVIDFNFS